MSFLKKIFKTVNRFLGIKSKSRRPVKARRKKKSKRILRKKLPAKKVAVLRPSPPKQIKSSIAKSLKSPAKSFNVLKSVAKVKEVKTGEVTHFFDRIQVAVIRIDAGQILKGETIFVRGKTTGEIKQKVNSMQVESVDVAVAKKGQLIGLKVIKPVRVGDEVFKALK